MRGNFRTLVTVALAAFAYHAWACIMHVELPKDVTKENYYRALEVRAPQSPILDYIHEEANRQAKELAQPWADYVVIATKNGEELLPGRDRTPRAGHHTRRR